MFRLCCKKFSNLSIPKRGISVFTIGNNVMIATTNKEIINVNNIVRIVQVKNVISLEITRRDVFGNAYAYYEIYGNEKMAEDEFKNLMRVMTKVK